MKKIYTGKFLKIYYHSDNKTFVQKWYISPKRITDFKLEMLEYTKLYSKYRPKNTLWLQQNFTLEIDYKTQTWIEKHVNKPCLAYGNKKCAFVVSQDILAHISVMDSFDEVQSCITPKHFATKQEAEKWLLGKEHICTESKEEKILFDGIDKDGNLIIKIPTNDIKHTLKKIQLSKEQEAAIRKNKYKLETLTKREKEVLDLIIQNKKHQEIADTLFISLHTMRTHWKKIKLKLNFESLSDLNIFLESLRI